MRCPFVVPRRAFVPLVLCSCLGLLASCAKGEKRTDTATADGSAAALPVASSGTPRVVQAGLPGALPRPLDSLSGDEFYDFTHKLTYGGGATRERRCKGTLECTTKKGTHTMVRVAAVDKQDSVSVTAIPDNGVVEIQARNEGPFVDEMYGMKPDKNLEYYLVLLPGTDLGGRWRLEELDTTPGARRHTSVAKGTLKPCMHAFVRHKVNRANFFTCEDAHMMTDSVMRSGLALQFSSNPPLWMDCAQGCCLATQP